MKKITAILTFAWIMLLMGLAGATVTYTQDAQIFTKPVSFAGGATGDITGTASRVAIGSFLDTSHGLKNATNKARINLTADDGLEFGTGATLGALGIKTGDGLDTGASGVLVDVTDFIDTGYGLAENANDIRVNLTANKGLEFGTGASQGSLQAKASNGISLGASGIAVNLTADKGLEIGTGAAAGGLQVEEGDGIDLGSGGVAVNATDIIDTGAGLKEDGSNNIQANVSDGLKFGTGATLGAIQVNITANKGIAVGTGSEAGSIRANISDGLEFGTGTALGAIKVKATDPSINVSSAGVSLGTGKIKTLVVAGASPGDVTVTGIAVGDELLSVVRFDVAADTGTDAAGDKVQAVSTITSEFTVGAAKINNAAGTDTSGDSLMVQWLDRTA